MILDFAAWPSLARPLLATYGPARVFQAGIECLRYPGNWMTNGSEYAAVKRHLEQAQPQN